MKYIFSLILLLALPSIGFPTQNINDGQFHEVDYSVTGDLNISNDSTVDVLAGSDIELDISIFDTSIANITGGVIGDDVWIYNDAELNVSGGNIGHVIGANDNSSVYLSGGSKSIIASNEFSYVEISGGAISDSIVAFDDSEIKIMGYNFEIDSSPIGSMILSSSTHPAGNLTGYLIDNTYIDVDFEILLNSSIVIENIPEPATLTLLTLGGLALRRRRIAML